MKKVFLLATMTMLSMQSFAQYTTTWDINVHRDPDYNSYGVKYQPMQTETRSSSNTNDFTRQVFESERRLREKWDAEERAMEDANKVVSQEVQLFNGIKLGTNQTTTVRASVVTRKNGRVDITCMGIKNGQTWKPCSKPIVSLQKMYNNAKSESEKSMILDLMDLGNYLLDTGNEMFVFK